MSKIKDITGERFGRLVAEECVGVNKSGESLWRCKCDCGNSKIVPSGSLRQALKGKGTRSCGCWLRETGIKNAKQAAIKNKQYNRYEFQNDYVIMYTKKNEPFYVDKEDFDKVKQICWRKDKFGYIEGKIPCSGNSSKKRVWLHRLIMDCPEGMEVDHIGGSDTLHDNRKANLRIVSHQQNCINRKLENSTSGCVGVTKHYNKWYARIAFNNKRYYLGSFTNIEDAIAARKEAERKYYGEYSYDVSQELASQQS